MHLHFSVLGDHPQCAHCYRVHHRYACTFGLLVSDLITFIDIVKLVIDIY